MPALTWLRSAVRNLFRRTAVDGELDAELRSYVDLVADEKIAAGMEPSRARREARMDLGGVEQVRQEVREARAGALVEQLVQDVRYGLRGLRRAPAFTAAIVITLALGIGANTAMFSVIDALLLRPLPVPDPDRLVAVYRGASGTEGAFAYPDFEELSARTDVLSGVAAWGSHSTFARIASDVERLTVHTVSPHYFRVLGTPSMSGPGFDVSSEVSSKGSIVVSDAFWRTRLGADPAVAGRVLSLGGQPMTIVGVAPPGVHGLDPAAPADAWITLASLAVLEPDWDFRARNEIWLRVVGRLPEGVDRRAAESALADAGRRISAGAPSQFGGGLRLVPAGRPLHDPQSRASSLKMAWLAAGVSGSVLLIACANVASLLIVRAGARRRELGVRLAIGASRGRIARQVITESVLLAVAGCFGALLVAWGTIETLVAFAPAAAIPRGITVALDGRVASFAAAASVFTALVCAAWPAQLASRIDLLRIIKGTPNAHGGSRGVMGLRRGLVIAQVALSAVLLVGAGLFLRTMAAAMAVEPGYDIDRVMVTTIDFSATTLPPAARQVTGERILEGVRAIPGVEGAALGQIVPFSGALVARPAAPEGQAVTDANESTYLVPYSVVSDGYFGALGLPLRGRGFGAIDGADAPKVVIINETLARQHWPGQDALGKRLTLPLSTPGPSYEVVGVVADGKYVSLTESQHPYMYLPWAQTPRPRMTLHVRTSGDPLPFAPAIRDVVRAASGDLPADRMVTLRSLVDRSVAGQRVAARMLTIFGLIALSVAAVGVYGLTAFTVMRRRQELGVRVALGARPADLLWMLVSQSAWLIAAGLLIGGAGALGLSRLVRSLLFGVTPSDPVSFVVGGSLLVVVMLAATLIPARRATTLSPLAALRAD
jgi:predicted permease